MSYTVTQIDLAPIPNVHGGTGTHQSTNWVVDPASVPGSGNLAFLGLDAEVTTLLFAIADNVVPNWFGVAVPRGISDFTRPHLFFHPTPGQAGYVDGDYRTKSGLWPQLFYYMERLGYQLDGARRNQVLIMPFMTEARKDGGILITDWQDIFTQILTQVRDIYDPSDQSALSIAQLVVSSFSAGMIYSDSFRRNGAKVVSLLAEVWDFDGRFSTYSWITQALHGTPQVQVIKYDQVASSDTSAYHAPLPRWTNLVNPPTSNMEVHALIRDFMFLDGATVTSVGSMILGPAGPAAGTGTHTGTAASTGTTAPPAGTVLPGGPGDSATGFTGSAGTHTMTAEPAGTHTTSATHVMTGTSSATAAHSGTSAPPPTGTHTGTAISGAHDTGSSDTGSHPPGHEPTTISTTAFGPIPAPGQPPPTLVPPPRLSPQPLPPLAAPTVPVVAPEPTRPGPTLRPPACSDCPAAVPAMVGMVAATSQASFTAITAMAGRSRRRR